MLKKKGFRFLEVVTPCPTLFQRQNNLGDGLAAMVDYKKRARSGTARPPTRWPGTRRRDRRRRIRGPQREDYLECMRRQLGSTLSNSATGRRGRTRGVLFGMLKRDPHRRFRRTRRHPVRPHTGRAVALHENGYATMTQNYGPEARGGAASAALVISDQPVLFPYRRAIPISWSSSRRRRSRASLRN